MSRRLDQIADELLHPLPARVVDVAIPDVLPPAPTRYVVRAVLERGVLFGVRRTFTDREAALEYALSCPDDWQATVNGDRVGRCNDCNEPVVEFDGKLDLFCPTCTREAREASEKWGRP